MDLSSQGQEGVGENHYRLLRNTVDSLFEFTAVVSLVFIFVKPLIVLDFKNVFSSSSDLTGKNHFVFVYTNC